MFETLVISLKVAMVATISCTVPAIALAYLMAKHEFKGKTLIQTLVTLPMVLPPVAIGFLLLKLLSKDGLLSCLNLLFTWKAAAVASSVMAFPLFVRPLEQAFREVPSRLEQVALSLGKSPWQVFATITLPLSKVGLVYGATLCFLRALGEFGATNLVAGNIPGKTQTLALGIYSHVENFEDDKALILAVISIVIAFFSTLAVEWIIHKPK